MVKGFVILKKMDGFYRLRIVEGECRGNCALCKKCADKDIVRVVGTEGIKKWNLYVMKHMERTADICMELYNDDSLYQSALVHDIGKFGIPFGVLFKKKPLNTYEWSLIRKHPEVGTAYLKKRGFDDKVIKIVLQHHEWYDGSGYPEGIKGLEIDLFARVISVADAFDSMINLRPYRKSKSFEKALNELVKGKGKQFDSNIVEKFIDKIRRERVCSK